MGAVVEPPVTMTEAPVLEEASLDIPERAVASLDMAAKQAALWLDTAAAVLPAGTAEAGAGPAPPAQVAEQPDMAARVEKLAQWAEARGTAERVVPAAAERQDTGAPAVLPARRGVVGLGERENDNSSVAETS